MRYILRDLIRLQNLDPQEIFGTTEAGTSYRLPPGPVTGRIVVIAVPENQIRYIISPQFINSLRQLAEQTKTIPIVRAVRNWRGTRQ